MILTKLATLFYIFFKLGLFSFGGGYVILPLMYQEIQTFNIMTPQEFSDLVALSQMTPGPIALNGATYVGYLYAGFWGSLIATIAVSLPSFIIILAVFAGLERFKHSHGVQAFLGGVRPATVGLIAAATIFFAQSSILYTDALGQILTDPLRHINPTGLCIALACGAALVKLKLNPITVSILGGLLGMIFMRG